MVPPTPRVFSFQLLILREGMVLVLKVTIKSNVKIIQQQDNPVIEDAEMTVIEQDTVKSPSRDLPEAELVSASSVKCFC